MLDDERDTLVAVLVHKNFECPALLLVVAASELEHNLVISFETVFDLLDGVERCPGQQLGYVLDLRVRFEHD